MNIESQVIDLLTQACTLYKSASFQRHSGHWDPTGRSGGGCPECRRARILRDEADILVLQARELIASTCRKAIYRGKEMKNFRKQPYPDLRAGEEAWIRSLTPLSDISVIRYRNPVGDYLWNTGLIVWDTYIPRKWDRRVKPKITSVAGDFREELDEMSLEDVIAWFSVRA